MYTEYLGPVNREKLYDSRSLLEQAARKLQQGQLVAFPTETIYGLGASILNARALENLYAVKGRPENRALPVLVANLDQVKFIAREVPQEFYTLAKEFLPGPLTVILKKNSQLSSGITGDKETVAVRYSGDPIARMIVEMTGCPLAVPSANISGKPSPTKANHVLEDFNGLIDGILDGGETQYGMESTVISLEDPLNPVVLRMGVITPRLLEKVLNRQIKIHPLALLKQGNSAVDKLRSVVRLFSSWEEMKIYLKLSSMGKRLVMSLDDTPTQMRCDHYKLTPKNLYEGLRLADRDGYAEVLVHCSPALKQNELLLNRLKQIARA